MKVILVPVADRPECLFALQAAFGLAQSLSANVEGCHVRPHRAELPTGNSARLNLFLAEGSLDELPEDVAALNCHRARELFENVARSQGVPLAKKRRKDSQPLAFWQEMVGSPDRILGIVGPVSDLIIVSRPKNKASGPARAFVLAAMLNSGKPVLILPQKKVNPGKRICIAWNCSVESARAVAAALPLLQKARSVHIVSSGPLDTPGPSVKQLQSYLALWGVEASSEITRGRNTFKEILEQYEKTDSDMLVMGAYSRSHLRQRIFGGVTHAMLNEPKVSLFALHS